LKRVGAVILTAILFLYQMPTAFAVGTSASAAILMDGESGRVLYEHNSHQPRLIASITKLMTALVALESRIGLDEIVAVPDEAVGVEGSSIYLQKGEELSFEALLYGMLLKSGNDAAVAIAILCSGSVEGFVAEMNRKALELGMKNSHFENPNGLNAEEHYSSAYDMALLAKACLDNQKLAEIVSTKNAVFGQRSFSNHNKLLWRYEGCVGLKTGYTEKAGRTLVSAAKKNGATLIAVTLNDPDDWNDHAELLDWGFARYAPVSVVQMGTVVARIPVEGALLPFLEVETECGLVYPVSVDDTLRLETELWKERIDAPVDTGKRLGVLRILCNEKIAAEIPLVAAKHVCRDRVEEENWLRSILHRM